MTVPEIKSIVEENAKVITTHTQDGASLNTTVNPNNTVETTVSSSPAVYTTHNVVPQVVTTITKDIQDITTITEGFWEVVWSVNGQTGDVTIDVVIANFQENTTYTKGAAVMYENELYVAKNTFTSGSTFNPADWKKIEPNATMAYQLFQPNHEYLEREAIWHDGSIYVANEDFTSGATFDEDDWTQASGGGSAEETTYDNSTSGLLSTNVQGALDEVDGTLDGTILDLTAHKTSTTAHTFIQDKITAINNKIPSTASSSNKLTDASGVASSISSAVSTHNSDTTAHSDIRSAITSGISSGISAHDADTTAHSYIQGRIDDVEDLIPAQATTSNQLADKAFVNSTVQTETANFRGNWNNWTSVPTDANQYPADYKGNKAPTVNDYMVVADASDYSGATLTGTWRFKYTGVWATNGKNGWNREYQVNEAPMTAAQLAALNSGITSTEVTRLSNAVTKVGDDTYSEIVPSITSAMITNDAITTAKIANNAVTTAKINDSSVTNAKIANNAVTTSKINDGAVSASKLSTDSVTTNKIADSAVSKAKMLWSEVLSAVYPVGSIYMTATLSTPSAVSAALGGGTWVAWGAGRVPVGVDTSQTEFDTAEETGGSKTHRHSADNMEALIGSPQSNSGALGFAQSSNLDKGTTFPSTYSVGGTTASASGHPKRSHNTKVLGETTYVSTLQPYITCYMYKRTA